MRKPIIKCIESIIFAIKDGVLCNHLVRLKMIELFLYYKHYYTTEELANLFFPVFDKRMEFFIKVYGAMHSAKSVKELAETTGYSLSNFKVQFKNFFGVTPYSWIIEQKLDRLRSSLQDESRPIKVIVEEFGFSDQSHLNNFCKRHLGGTAKNVREEMNRS